MDTHESKNTSPEHLAAFYSTFNEVKREKFAGLIVTGAPVENLNFDQVDYWPELCEILDWSTHNVFSTLHICWGAQAGLYRYYGIPKHPLPAKQFGVYDHFILDRHERIVRGFDEIFPAPHSRHTANRREDIVKVPELRLVAESREAGVFLIASKDGRKVFVTGHPEYDRGTLQAEYERDVKKGLPIEVPRNYFPGDDPRAEPRVTWKSHAHLLYANWLNYYVYQETPFDLAAISDGPAPQADDFSI
jgi:homoserine O-succinyltransferase